MADVEPLYYVKGATIFQRPVEKTKPDGSKTVTMGFAVCSAYDGVDPAEVCALLNKAEPATDGR